MKSYKKLLITLLLIFASIFSVGIATEKAFAEQEKKVKTEMFLPSTYFEYYALNSPVDVCYDADTDCIYIAESNAVVIYNRATELYTRLDCQTMNPSISSWEITKIDCYKGYIFILNASRIYYCSVKEPTKFTQTDITVANYFYIVNNRLYSHTSSTIEAWIISLSDTITFGSFNSSENKYEPNIIYKGIALSNASVYSPTTSSLYYFNNSECLKLNPDGNDEKMFEHSTNYASFYNGKIYFIKNNGFYEFDESLKTSPVELFSLNETTNSFMGFCFIDGKILIVNNLQNEIWEYDLTASDFTGKYVATYKVADNRLTADVTDMVISEDYLYVLQKSSLARFSLDGTEHLTVSFPKDFSLIDFEPLHFSVIKDKIMLSNGKKLKAFTLSDSENALSATENTINVVGTWEENNICGLYAFDEEFYLLKNRTINNVQYAVIYKINQTPSQYEIDAEGFIYKKEGTGISFTINSFGELYLLATEGVSGKKITCFDIINKEEALITTPLGEGVKKIISDFENVYVLDESTIYSVYENEYYKIEKSANFNQLDNPVSFTADLTSGKTYFLYGGYILQSDSLPLKTPNAYTVPEDYTAFEQNPQTATVSSGAKLFTVTADGNFFKYNSIISAGEGEYLLICELSEDFCIIGFEEYSYLARKQDLTLTEISTFTPEFIQGYYVTKAGKYAQPMLNLTYKIADVVAYEKVTVISGVTVNQIPFYEVKFEDETKGYIQKSFIVEFISEESIRENFYLAKCSKTDIYAEDGTTVIGKMDAGAVKVYGKENELYKITFKDGFGYIKSDAIIQKENKTFKYTLAIMLVATSFTISAIYLLIRRNRKNSI